ncbi:MAG: RNase adapter RapZ [Alphaproteobacteria bacterium CG11_big_fil_rev_8_21_14_0_20_44_7]|nr:MAG: RNase adapter RapZ [Alphaproteobacteria bacterium CG11_big_fil_rev_8_21_14_0_20_44_7]
MGKELNNVVLVTGTSGAGKSIALKALEDLGYNAIDNIPLSILPTLIEAFPENGMLAIGVDARNKEFSAEKFVEKTKDFKFRLLFLDADADVLYRRFSETRRRHPLALDRPISDGIRHEKQLVEKLRDNADYVVDTSNFSQSDLRNWVRGHFSSETDNLLVTITSFSYKKGIPREADLVFDARFLKNPFYNEALKEKNGKDKEVGEYIKTDDNYKPFLKNLLNLVLPLLPAYREEGKSYLTIAIGCTGGQHRSVFVAEKLAKSLIDKGYKPTIRHRDL